MVDLIFHEPKSRDPRYCFSAGLLAQLSEVFRRAYAQVHDILPIEGPEPEYWMKISDREKWAIGGTASDGWIVFDVRNMSQPGFSERLEHEFPIVFAHETHHVLRLRAVPEVVIGDRLALEGTAIAAGFEVSGGNDPYSYDIDSTRLSKWLDYFAPRLNQPLKGLNDEEWDWVRGTEHALGRYLVERYRAQNDSPTARDMITTPTAEILKATFG